jgi:ribonuclease HII
MGVQLIAGVDEAGRGAWAGPVVAAAVIMPPKPRIGRITDSKLIPPAERENLFHQITSTALAWAVTSIGPEEISRTNILRAAHQAMAQAVAQLDPQAEFVLIDGRPVPEFPWPNIAIPDGDARCYSIAAASIVAKVWRDRIMHQLDQVHPGYGFARHKGYGTFEHRLALNRLGPCEQHRMTFAPLQALAQGQLHLKQRC